MQDRIHWELHRRRADEIVARAERDRYMPRPRRKNTRRPRPDRESE